MLSVEWIPRLISLDLQWFIEIAMDNLLWIFMFAAIVFIYNKKFSWKFFLILVLGVVGYVEFMEGIGIILLVAMFLFVYYTGEVIILTFAESVPSLKNRFPLILTIYAVIMISLYTMNVFG